jgi:hypothetical protein
MKTFSTLLIAAIAALSTNAQAVLNEIYAYPSVGNHEFFELYNTSTSQTPVSVDGYTLVSYFKDNSVEGFYVMDLPNLSMVSKGFLVGSSAIPFNYQGNNNIINSDFNWNDPDFRSGTTGGYLKKWVKSTNNLSDGNLFYDEEVLPLDFNDFFEKRSGGGASFNAFLYKNGLLVNSFVGGTGGNTFIPTFIRNMPTLNFISINNGVSFNYEINYNSYSTGIAEYVIQDIGSDNGYMRESDGLCGTWEKSSSQAFHTPQQTNGGSQMTATGSLTINTHISRGVNGDPSFIVYNVTAGPSLMFPVDLYVYADNGSVVGQWDANDVFLEGHVENAVTDGPFTTYFTPVNQQLILVVKTAVGCYDQVRLVLNPEPPVVVLPITIKQFSGSQKGDQYLLEWVTLNNESGNSFELEKSNDGKIFSKVNTIAATTMSGESYYSSLVPLTAEAHYRLKVISKDKHFYYSHIVYLKQSSITDKLSLLQNPITSSSLHFVFQAGETGTYNVTVYNSSGERLLNKQYTLLTGKNIITTDLNSKIPAGVYLLEVTGAREKQSKRFIKN